MAKWFVAAKRADFNKIGEQFHISPVLARVIRNRDVIGEEAVGKYLYGTSEDLYDPCSMKNIEQAAALLRQSIAEGKRIRVIGDYDIDGICAAYILVSGLRALQADVDYAIPHRVKDGYGINNALIRQAYEDGREVIVTCDNGISASEQVIYAKELGLSVIITDHHEVPYEDVDGERIYRVPDADAVVDPKQPGDQYPNPGICGAVVAYKLLQVLYSDGEDLPGDLPEIAAIATVGDVMELLDENRIIVKEGLARLNKTQNIGLRSLIGVCGLSDKKISAYHIGFVLGPCLNATGRLDAADSALELLLCREERRAVLLANQLKDINESRKYMTEIHVQQAVEMIESGNHTERVLVLYLPECHESLAGIIAGRIRERYYRPVFVLTDGEEGIKGSGRSIPGYNMHGALMEVQALLEKFGGHSMAAGLSLSKANLLPFKEALNRNCKLEDADLEKKTLIDVPMPFSYCTKELAQELELLEPFGNGNEKPVFAQKDVHILSERVLGKNRNVAKYQASDSDGRRFELTYFGDIDGFREVYRASPGAAVHVIYYPSINKYQGRETLQLVMQDYMPAQQD